MENLEDNSILIIGGPNSGKTHFGGQLYGRLIARSEHFKLKSNPDDITIFKEVWDRLNEGRSASHTNVSMHKTLKLEIESDSGAIFKFTFPDYGGEQISTIVRDRRINRTWMEQIEKSNSWLLFIRLDELVPIEDVANRGIPDQEIMNLRQSEHQPMKLSPVAFYMELLQSFLYAKRISTKHSLFIPKLTVVLSCWDLLTPSERKKIPEKNLQEKLPGLFHFLQSNWTDDFLQIIGLSSTGRTLSDKDIDHDFAKRGPEDFGYIISHSGKKNSDLTLTIKSFLES